MPKSKADIEVSDEELMRLTANRTMEDRLKDSLIHMVFVAKQRHPFDPDKCTGCKEAKKLAEQ